MPKRLLAFVATAVLVAGLAYATAVPSPWNHEGSAALRLSWSARPERIETCRTLSAEELAARPAHMRRPTECTGTAASYSLRVTVDGTPLVERTLQGQGVRGDRPIFVFDEWPVSPGERRIEVRATRIEPADAPMDSTNLRRGAVSREIALDTTLVVAPGTVLLVSLDGGALGVRTP